MKRFGRRVVLEDLSFRVPSGVVLGLIGPNGSGKTTLMRILAGLLRPTSGLVEVHGRSAAQLRKDPAWRIGYMPQAGGIYPELTVRQNVGFFAAMERLHGAAREQSVDQALQAAGLLDRARSRASTLSGGMKRRLSMACTLVHQPGLALLDEPTVGVDPALRRDLWAHLHDRARRGSTILVSTHDMGEAMRCDAVLFLREGRRLALDSPQNLLARTKSTDLEAAYLRLAEARPTNPGAIAESARRA